MAHKEALKTLLEAADLISMVEDLFSPGVAEKLSSSSVSGMRLTLRGVRSALLEGHDLLAADIIMRSKGLSGDVQTIHQNSEHQDQNGWEGDHTTESTGDHHIS